MRRQIVIILALLICLSGYAQKQYDSYKGLVMAGYQGWFNTPGDGEGRGWYHYKGSDGFRPGSCSIDIWPETSEYDKLYDTEFRYADGSVARTFSSNDASTVDTHFRWMKEYGLDGVFMQRFVPEIKNPSGKKHFTKLLNDASVAANKYGRAFCVMYDLSGMNAGDEKILLNDIRELTPMLGLKNRADNPSYLWHNGRPLVVVWGVGFNDRRQYGLKEANAIVDGLKKQGFSVMLGVPTHWRELKYDTESDPRLHALIKKCDIIMPWFVGRYNESTYPFYKKLIGDDVKWCKAENIDYAPLCFPGFSWKNMKGAQSLQIDRNNGNFFWKQLSGAIEQGAEMIYVAMFDEIDEGTAVFKCARNVPVGDSRFVALDDETEPDHYLWLIGQAGSMLKKEKPLSASMPVRNPASQRLVYNGVFAPYEGLVNRLEKPYRKEICLNGYWDFQPVRLPADYRQGGGKAPELPMPSADGWSKTKIKIPSPWNVNDFSNRNLEGPDHRNYPSYPREWNDVKMAWMKKTFDVPADWTGDDIRLWFEAVAGETVVYVNGHKVAGNFDLFLPFSADITDVVKPGEKADVLVGVRSQKLFEDNSTIGRRIVPGGSMWGYDMNGIWQDVYLQAVPRTRIEDIYVKPLVGRGTLEIEVTLTNSDTKKLNVELSGDISEWINLAGTDVNSAPVPAWELGRQAMAVKPVKVSVAPGDTVRTVIALPVAEGTLKYWTPETPNLYSLVLSAKTGGKKIDTKYERFGWREWTLEGTSHLLNGKVYPLRGDSWHFMGIPQMTRRYAYAWYKAIKDMNGNAVRPHAMVYPRFYHDMADEMGICILNETANWASDGGPKLDSPHFWEASKDHLRRFVMRDRNHASVFGWSVSNENKPVILYVYNRPDLLEPQMVAWREWRDIVRELDPTRPWISSDGEDDGDGILPVTVGHYGDVGSMHNWINIGKPWGIGEHSMAYYGTPEQVAKYNGERAYVSALGRMEGLANECYNLIKDQRDNGASYSTVFNMAWYALQPLPIGKKDITTPPSMENDGIFFGTYTEGQPGVQPERVGPYSTTLNPGYDPSLPLYRPWPMFEAMRAANAPDGPAWSEWAEIDKKKYESKGRWDAATPYRQVVFVGSADSRARQQFDAQGVIFSDKVTDPANALYVLDGTYSLSGELEETIRKHMSLGADLLVWGINPANVQPHNPYNGLLPLPVTVNTLRRSSFIPAETSWMRGLNPSDFYFCEVQQADAAQYTLTGPLVEESEVILEACRTDWRTWNKRAENLKTAALLRSENECTTPRAVVVKYSSGPNNIYLSTLGEFTNTEKGFKTLGAIIANAGIPCKALEQNPDEIFFFQDNKLLFPRQAAKRMVKADGRKSLTIYVYSPRPLDDLLIEPNMPKLTLRTGTPDTELVINGKPVEIAGKDYNRADFRELPLLQGWNCLEISMPESTPDDKLQGHFFCDNRADYLPQVRASYVNPEAK